MATNEVYEHGRRLAVACTDPATPASGDPCRVGQITGVALVAEGSDGITTMTTEGVYLLSVKGVNAGGNVAIAAGDVVFYVDADTPKLSAKIAGVRFGYALAAVGSGLTATIPVRVGY